MMKQRALHHKIEAGVWGHTNFNAAQARHDMHADLRLLHYQHEVIPHARPHTATNTISLRRASPPELQLHWCARNPKLHLLRIVQRFLSDFPR